MRTTYKFRPDALDHRLEDRRVPATLTALAPLVNLATYNTMFGIGTQVNPVLTTSPFTTGFASPLFNGFTATGAGLGTAFANPNFLNGLGPLGLLNDGFGSLGGVATPALNFGISPVSSLALNGGLTGVGAFPPTAGVGSFAGANYAPTGLAIQSGLFPTVLQPAGGLSYYTGIGFTPTVPASLVGSTFYGSNYTTGVGYLNGLGVSNGLTSGSGFNNGVAPLGLFGLNSGNSVNTSFGFLPAVDLTSGAGLAGNPGTVNNGGLVGFSPGLTTSGLTPLLGGLGTASMFTTSPFSTPSAFGSSFTTSPFVPPAVFGSSLSPNPFVTPTNFVNGYGFLTF